MSHRVEEQLMSWVRIAGLLIILLTAGCAGMDRASQGEPPKTGVTQEKTPAPEPQQAAAPLEKAVATTPPQTAPKQDVPVAVEPVAPPAAPTTVSTNQSAAKPEAPAAKPPAKAPASPASKEPAPKKESAAPPAPPLDLASLETRLKETNAIGVFTKLTLKNQVDALLDQFRGYYEGRIKTTLAQLRQPYDQLLLKVLSLLQDSDPPLARAIAQSREAIWGILSDPNKFKSI
jgi:outer membrane biosynthesis protein TonB